MGALLSSFEKLAAFRTSRVKNMPSVGTRHSEGQRCEASWYKGTPQSVAQRLLGCTLVRTVAGQRCSGIIVEVEAYLAKGDPASHSARGERPSNRTMFQQYGRLYVYPIHSRYCLNVVTEPIGVGSAVLIRAIQPRQGLERMFSVRMSGNSTFSADGNSVAQLRHLTSGPARLCEALSVDRSLDGVDLLTDENIWLEHPADSVRSTNWSVRMGPRIGISQGKELQLRWFVDGHQLVSGRASDHSSGRFWTFL